MENKKEGAYYTPIELAAYVVKKMFSNIINSEIPYEILEPSCGDGNFLEAIANYSFENNISITAIEKNEEEIEKAKKRIKKININFFNENYLEFQEIDEKVYDLVLGNPPYVNKKYLDEKDILLTKNILSRFNLKVSSINLWIPFVLSSIEKLKDNGSLALVLPSEILLTISSENIRKILLKRFKYIEVINFNEIVFKGIEQDTIVLLCHSNHIKTGISYYTTQNIQSLVNEDFDIVTHHSKFSLEDKWSQLALTVDEIAFLKNIKNKFKTVSEVCTTSPGIVTGANSYFIVNKEETEKYSLHNYIKPIIPKSLLVKQGTRYTNEDFNDLVNKNKKCYFLDFSKLDNEHKIKEYLDLGLREKINEGFKCRNREKWYVVPNIEKQSDILFFKRNYLGLKIVLNESNALVTDGAYIINLKEIYDKKSFIFGFYSLIPLIFSEILGRFYGGGVLELTPGEFKSLPFVYNEISSDEFLVLNEFIKKNDFEQIIDYTSKKLLINKLGFSDNDVKQLKVIWRKLTNRRFKKVEKAT